MARTSDGLLRGVGVREYSSGTGVKRRAETRQEVVKAPTVCHAKEWVLL